MRYLLTALLFLPALVSAQELHRFKNGEVADADKVNENFETIYNLAGGEGGTITIVTEPVATTNPHPVTVQFQAPAGIFYWNVTDRDYYHGSDRHLINQNTNHIHDYGVSIPLGVGATISAHLLDMNGRPAVASKSVSAETAIVFGNYVWESGAQAPVFENVPTSESGESYCPSLNLLESEHFSGFFCEGGSCNCSELSENQLFYEGLPAPIDETGAIACVAPSSGSMAGMHGPLFSLENLSFNTYDEVSYRSSSGWSNTLYSFKTYHFQPAPNPSVEVQRTDYCRLTIDGDTEVYSASSSYSGTYNES